MPLCHNLIEALAMGAIPILQYPQYMTPPLTDNVNCLRYQDAEDLIKVINTALQLSLADKRKLSDNAKNYYLNSASFIVSCNSYSRNYLLWF